MNHIKIYLVACLLFFGLVGYGQEKLQMGGKIDSIKFTCVSGLASVGKLDFFKYCDSSQWTIPAFKDSLKIIIGILDFQEWLQKYHWKTVVKLDSIIRRRERTIEYLKKQVKSGSGISAVGGVLHPGPGRIVDMSTWRKSDSTVMNKDSLYTGRSRFFNNVMSPKKVKWPFPIVY